MPTQPLRVLWRYAAPEVPLDPALLPEGCELIFEPDQEAARARMDGVHVLLDNDAALLDAPDLRHVVVSWAGLPPALREGLLQRPHLTAHNSHYNAPFVAQHAVALLLAVSNHMLPSDAALRRGDWSGPGEGPRSMSLAGEQALLLGYGAIGRHVAPTLLGLGMRVVAFRQRAAPPDNLGVPAVDASGLDQALSRSRVVVCSLPGTPATFGLIDQRRLGLMPEGGVVVNVGRGAVFEEDALYQALVDRRLRGAGLDVWYRYRRDYGQDETPYPANRPFWELPNVVMSPHRAADVDEAERARAEDVAATLRALAAGELRNRVDVQKGF